MRACGYTYKECEAEGFALPVLHAELDYRKPARYDDLLEIECRCEEQRGVRLKIACDVRRDGELLVSGHTVHCFVSLETMRPAHPPAKFLQSLAEE